MIILDIVLQISCYEVSKKLNKYVLIQKKIFYATKMGKYTSCFPVLMYLLETSDLTAFQCYNPRGTQSRVH